MEFSKFSLYFSRLESTTKRLEITAILSELLKELNSQESDKAVYLTLGMLGPLFNNKEFAIAEKMMIKALVLAYDVTEDDVKAIYAKEGDLGNTAEALRKHKHWTHESPDVTTIYTELYKIAELSGTGSQEKKLQGIVNLLKLLDSLSTRYIVRIPIGKTRLGFSEITIIEALSWMETGTKELKKDIEHYFHIYPDIGRITKLFKKGGLKGLEEVNLETGVPILPQLCQRVSSADEAVERLGGIVSAEYKYDGTRVQLHMDRNKKITLEDDAQLSFFGNPDNNSNNECVFVKTYTRNLEDSSHMFPDLVKAAIEGLKVDSIILDGEAVGIDPKTGKLMPFQETSQRKRKHNVLEKINEIPLRYFVFDILYLNGEVLLNKTFEERREILSKVVVGSKSIVVDNRLITSDSHELAEYFRDARSKGIEGLVIKRPDSPYEAGGRGYSWVKFKREEKGGLDDTVDVVILGYYLGRGNRAKFGIGGFLVGVYDKDKDRYVTVSKVGSGATEEEWGKIKQMSDKISIKEPLPNVEVHKSLYPDVWIKPELVVVVRADEITVSETHTAGFALRFPRLMEFRYDKKSTDTTTIKELKDLYDLQIKNLQK